MHVQQKRVLLSKWHHWFGWESRRGSTASNQPQSWPVGCCPEIMLIWAWNRLNGTDLYINTCTAQQEHWWSVCWRLHVSIWVVSRGKVSNYMPVMFEMSSLATPGSTYTVSILISWWAHASHISAIICQLIYQPICRWPSGFWLILLYLLQVIRSNPISGMSQMSCFF